MKLAVSNIAWPSAIASEAYDVLRANGIAGVEIAPTTIWPDWRGITDKAIHCLRSQVEAAGLQIPSLQSVLFQRPELQLFGSPDVCRELLQHLTFCADLAAGLGASCVVLGAPRNRDRGALSDADALEHATNVFLKAAEAYQQRGVSIGFEANPTQYGCNFATDSGTAAELVRRVGSPGFRLHLDTACLRLAGEDVAETVAKNVAEMAHFHVSEPDLGEFPAGTVDHRETAQALASYRNWVSLEMRMTNPVLPGLRRAVHHFGEIYGE